MNRQIIRLNESDLHRLIENAVYSVLMENEEDEGLWNQMKQGAKSFFGNGYGKNREDKDGNLTNYRNSVRNRQERGDWTANSINGTTPFNLKKRWQAAKTGFKEQGNVDNANEVIDILQGLIQNGVITPNMTVKQVMNKMTGNRLSAQRRVSKANNAIYKGMDSGVMGTSRFDKI